MPVDFHLSDHVDAIENEEPNGFFNRDEEQKGGGFLETRARTNSFTDNRIETILSKIHLMQEEGIIYNFDIHFGSNWIKLGYTDTPYSSVVYSTEEFLALDPYTADHTRDLRRTPMDEQDILTALESMKILRTYNDTRFLIFFRLNAIENKITTTTSTGKTRIFRSANDFKDYTIEKMLTKKQSTKRTIAFGGEKEYIAHANRLKRICGYPEKRIDEIINRTYDLFVKSQHVFSMDFHCGSGMIKAWYNDNPYTPEVLSVDQYLRLNAERYDPTPTKPKELIKIKSKISNNNMTDVLKRAKDLRAGDPYIYLRYLSVNIPGDEITTLFSCGGTYCMPTKKFLGPEFNPL